MGERKGVNKYYPPDFDYKKHGSLDRYHNSHPLRERARKLKSEGILIIRFEMPYNIWCNGCNSHIGMGVRYNAEKKKVGNYYSTIIYKFRMKCHLCEQYFEIQTDPANCEYVILSGARRKEERWNAKDNEQIEMTDREVKKKLITDPMFKLEHGVNDKQKLQVIAPTLSEIQDLQSYKRDDYLLNKALRQNFRMQKKKVEHAANVDKALLQKSSLDITLLEESAEDRKMAALMKYQTVKSFTTKQIEERKRIFSQPVLSCSVSSQQCLSDVTPLTAHLTNQLQEKSLPTKQVSHVIDPQTLGIKLTRRKRSLSENIENPLPNKVFPQTYPVKIATSKPTNYMQKSITSNESNSSKTNIANTCITKTNKDLQGDPLQGNRSLCSGLVANYSSDDDS